LAQVLRTLSQLVCLPRTGMPTDAGKTKTLHGALSKDLDSVLVLSEQAAVENVMFCNLKSFSTTFLEHITSHVQALSLITTALLRRTKLEEWQLLNQSAQAAEADLRCDVASHLQDMAASVESGQPLPSNNLESAFAKWNVAAAGIVENDRPRLVRRLVGQVQSLV
jgi:hypothetical protein